MKIINMTGKNIAIFSQESTEKIRKGSFVKTYVKLGEVPFTKLISQGCIIAAEEEVEEGVFPCFSGGRIIDRKITYSKPEGVPDKLDDDAIYVVTRIAACALLHSGYNMEMFRVKSGPVLSEEDDAVIGYTGLARYL
ncbi:hypothetical protein [Succinivibrio dextrinosolvens]|jgi:hypothetical protein|uniref:hypothetical protein n=1 Tax=Succinivibrio dextrinosolvens TaxID=83771 RepID=UPI00241FAE45|nr:hypothetical protein [Succinivibrio dextrinosolvens]MBE6423106.1 hypothetical protein [Succinivibrio dextrinosolvens]